MSSATFLNSSESIVTLNISPVDKSNFLKYLAEEVDHLVLVDDCLLPTEEL